MVYGWNGVSIGKLLEELQSVESGGVHCTLTRPIKHSFNMKSHVKRVLDGNGEHRSSHHRWRLHSPSHPLERQPLEVGRSGN
jgi:hypothetical protein